MSSYYQGPFYQVPTSYQWVQGAPAPPVQRIAQPPQQYDTRYYNYATAYGGPIQPITIPTGDSIVGQTAPVLPPGFGYPPIPPAPYVQPQMFMGRPEVPQPVFIPGPLPASPSSSSRSSLARPMRYADDPPSSPNRNHWRRRRRRSRSPSPSYQPTFSRITRAFRQSSRPDLKPAAAAPCLEPTALLPWMIHPDSTSPPPQFNPLLSGDAHQQSLIIVDLRVSSTTFEPQRLTSAGSTAGSPLSQQELSQPATYPAVTEMTITCDEIPQWPIELKPRSDHAPPTAFYASDDRHREPPPLTVHDVLYAIQRSVRNRISHEDWAKLSRAQEKAVADAYSRRCRANPETRAFEESQGVRRVDYLLDNYHFKGLVFTKGPEPFKDVKLLVGKK